MCRDSPPLGSLGAGLRSVLAVVFRLFLKLVSVASEWSEISSLWRHGNGAAMLSTRDGG